MPTKTLFNQDDSRFAVVKWVSDREAYNVVSLNLIQVLPEPQTEYSLNDHVYYVMFGFKKCKALILFIGNLIFFLNI